MSANTQGTQMPWVTDARVQTVIVLGMGEQPRSREKVSPKGEPTFSTGCLLKVLSKDGTTKIDKTASVNVINPAEVYDLAVTYRAEGRIYVQPYENNGRIAYSILCEKLVPAVEKTGPVPPGQ